LAKKRRASSNRCTLPFCNARASFISLRNPREVRRKYEIPMPALPGRGRLAANLAVGEPPAATVKKAAGTPVAPESAARRFALFHNRPSGKKKELP
jgi:hypothetical protein